METVSLQRAFRAGSEDEGLLPRLQSLGEHGPRTVHGPRLVWLYCVIEDVVRQILGETRLRSRGPTPELTDVESLTIEIFGETLGMNSDASIWRYACDHLRDWFPGLGTEWNFVRRCANLCWLNVQDALFYPSRDWTAFFRCRCASTHGRGGISGSGAMVRLAAKQEKYYGFKVLMNSAGEIFRWWPATTDEREMLDASAMPVRRQGADLRRLQLAGRGVDLTTPLRANMKDDRG